MRTATVSLDPFTLRTIGGAGPALDRLQWFGVHTNDAPSSSGWRPEDVAEFSASGYRAHPGRSFFVSSRMQEGGVVEDAARPGFVDVPSLLASCAAPAPLGWPVGEVDMVVSSKPDQLYNNSCQGATGQAPKGFMPGSHAATAEFFALFYEHCMPATAQPRVLMEVANECDVKTGAAACDSPWAEMIALHAAVGDAVHAAYRAALAAAAAAAAAPPAKPFVCGPTAAFPEYQLHDFKTWRAGGQFEQFFFGGTNGSIDCLSVHLYSTFGGTDADPADPADPAGAPPPPDPFSSDYTAREVSNLAATLDLQEAATAAASGNGAGSPLPVLISEYGAAFKDKTVRYSPAHDWWVLRSVTTKLMSFLDRPDRILKALPFLVDKATWDQAGMTDNATFSYPWALWRFATPSGAAAGQWLPTYLHLHFAAWRDVQGERIAAASDDANVQIQAFRTAVVAGTATRPPSANWTVAANNADHTTPARVALSWAALPDGAFVEAVTVRRLRWDAGAGAPTLTDTTTVGAAAAAALPASLELDPSELAIVAVRVGAPSAAALAPAATMVDTRTLHSSRLLAPLVGSQPAAAAAAYAYRGALLAGGGGGAASARRVRVSLGGPAASRDAALASLHVVVNGAACAVDPNRQVGGQAHTNANDGSFLTSIEVAVPAAASSSSSSSSSSSGDVVVEVWADAAGGIVVSTVALEVEVVVVVDDARAAGGSPAGSELFAGEPERAGGGGGSSGTDGGGAGATTVAFAACGVCAAAVAVLVALRRRRVGGGGGSGGGGGQFAPPPACLVEAGKGGVNPGATKPAAAAGDE